MRPFICQSANEPMKLAYPSLNIKYKMDTCHRLVKEKALRLNEVSIQYVSIQRFVKALYGNVLNANFI